MDPNACYFPGDESRTLAPNWVCDEPVEGVSVSAVGSAPKTSAGIDLQKQKAAASARVQLAQAMKIQVNNMIKDFAETTGTGDAETVDQVFTSVSKLITSETLVGSRIFKTTSAPDGTLWVLVGMDEQTAAAAAQAAVNTSMNNDQALWQKFMAEKAQEELDAAISSQFGN
jgi:hypothetical protein